MQIKLIHPETQTVREVDSSRTNKIAILKRAGFIDFKKYKPPARVAKPKPEPTTADVVESHKEELKESDMVNEPEIAIHMSAAARQLVESNDLDPALIEGTGVDGQINKPDVVAFLEENPPEKPESDEGDTDGEGEGEIPGEAPNSGQDGSEDEETSAKDIQTHDDAPKKGE